MSSIAGSSGFAEKKSQMTKHVLISSFLTRSGLKVLQNSPWRCATQWIQRSKRPSHPCVFQTICENNWYSGFCNVLIINSILDCNCKLSSCRKQTQSAAECVSVLPANVVLWRGSCGASLAQTDTQVLFPQHCAKRPVIFGKCLVFVLEVLAALCESTDW